MCKWTLGQLGKNKAKQTQTKPKRTQFWPIKRQNEPNSNPIYPVVASGEAGTNPFSEAK